MMVSILATTANGLMPVFVLSDKSEYSVLGSISPAFIGLIIPFGYVLLTSALVVVNLELETENISCFGRQ